MAENLFNDVFLFLLIFVVSIVPLVLMLGMVLRFVCIQILREKPIIDNIVKSEETCAELAATIKKRKLTERDLSIKERSAKAKKGR